MIDLDHRPTKNGAPDCWCLPTVQSYEYGDVVVHNDPKAKGGES